MRNNRRLALGAALLASALLASACGGGGGGPGGGGTTGGSPAQKGTLTVGVSGAFAESQVVAEMYAQVLENAGYTVNRQLDLGTREISDKALFSGDIDLKPEYTGFEIPAVGGSTSEGYGPPQQVRDRLAELLKAKGIDVLEASPANSTNAFVVTQETADKYSLQTVSDLAPVAGQLTLGGPPECPKRPFCEIGLKNRYGVEFGDFKPLDFGGPETEAALSTGAIDVALLFSLNPNIAKNGWVSLEDDKNLQAVGNFVAIIREDAENEQIDGLLNDVTTSLTNEGMLDLVNRIVNDKEDVGDVAGDYLQQQGLL